MIENEQNKKLFERMVAVFEKRGLKTFAFEWQGTRVPRQIKFPEGSQRDVSYMRNGILIFNDKTSAVYGRLKDIYPKQPQRILVGYDSLTHQKE